MANPTTEKSIFTLDEAHGQFARAYNARVWELLANGERSADETEEMLRAAHCSLEHWAKFSQGKPANLQRGLWLLATVYTSARYLAEALRYAQACETFTKTYAQHLEVFDVAYMYLALARVYALAEQRKVSMQYFTLARQMGEKIEAEEDKKIFLHDFRTKI